MKNARSLNLLVSPDSVPYLLIHLSESLAIIMSI